MPRKPSSTTTSWRLVEAVAEVREKVRAVAIAVSMRSHAKRRNSHNEIQDRR
jgi:hypothetical protein